MARAMSPVLASSFAANLPNQPLRESGDGYEFRFTQLADGIEMTAARGADQANGTIRWVMGAGAQGETPLIEADGKTLESHISFFPAVPQYGVTVGQHGGASPNAHAALGLPQTRDMLAACLGCHATAVTRDLQPLVPGIQCQRCHAGSEAHVQDPVHNHPVNPGKLSARSQVEFCGTCHRFVSPDGENALENVRFQPYRLAKSRCFTSGKLACTTCHPAHQDAKRNDDAFYNERCLTCHTPPHRTGDCVSCHMPRVRLHPALAFTDHDIR